MLSNNVLNLSSVLEDITSPRRHMTAQPDCGAQITRSLWESSLVTCLMSMYELMPFVLEDILDFGFKVFFFHLCLV